MVALHGGQTLVARGTAAGTETDNVSQYPMFIAATAPFALLATIFFFSRLYSRMVPILRLHWDDYLVALGYVRFKYPGYTTYTMLTTTSCLLWQHGAFRWALKAPPAAAMFSSSLWRIYKRRYTSILSQGLLRRTPTCL
jgi:hypothetical protein